MSTRTFHLTEHFDGFIAAGVQAGRYSDASEAVQAGLRLLEQQEQEDKAKIEWLRGAIQEGSASMDRGESITLTSGDEIDEFVRDIHREIMAEHHSAENARV